MTRKRKSVPQKADESKRQHMSWNMFDGGGLQVVDDNDPALLLEREQSESTMVAAETSKPATELTAGPSRASLANLQNSKLAKILIDECDFFVGICSTFSSDLRDQWNCKLGSFKLQLDSTETEPGQINEALSKCAEFWLYVNKETSNHLVYFEIPENDENLTPSTLGHTIVYCQARSDFPLECLTALQVKVIPLVLLNYDVETACLEVGVYATGGALTQLKFSSEGARPKHANLAVKMLVNHFYSCQLPGEKTFLYQII